MAKKIHVNKPFVFNFPAEGNPPTAQRAFSVGIHEIEDDVAAHPWIAAGADGHISAELPPEAPVDAPPSQESEPQGGEGEDAGKGKRTKKGE